MRDAKLESSSWSRTRRRVYDFVSAHPGSSVSEVAGKLDLYWTSAALQVNRLVSAGLVISVLVGRRRLLFPAEGTGALSSRSRGLLAEPACRRVAVAIAKRPHLRVWELCELLSMSERAVYHHVKRLASAGLVTSTSRLYRGLEPSPQLLQFLAQDSNAESTGGQGDDLAM